MYIYVCVCVCVCVYIYIYIYGSALFVVLNLFAYFVIDFLNKVFLLDFGCMYSIQCAVRNFFV